MSMWVLRRSLNIASYQIVQRWEAQHSRAGKGIRNMDKYTEKMVQGLEINTLDFGILLFLVKNISSFFWKVNFALKHCDFTVKSN